MMTLLAQMSSKPDRKTIRGGCFPGEQVPSLSQRLGQWSGGQCGGDQWVDRQHGHQVPGDIAFFNPAGVPRIDMGKCRDQILDSSGHMGGRAAVAIATSRGVSAAPWGTICPNAISWPCRAFITGVLCRTRPSRMRKTVAAPCVISILTGTKRIVGRCVADRRCVGSISFLRNDKGLYRGGWDEPQFVCQIADLAAPEVRAAAGLHRHNTRPRLAEEGQNLAGPQFLAPGTHSSPDRARP